MDELIERALDLFTDQFEESRALNDLAASLMQPFASIQTDVNDLITKRWLDTAFGVQLDLLGDTVGEPRKGRNDEDYRNAIRFRIFINVSKTEPETIIEATRTLSKGELIRYWENYPAGFQVFTDGPNVLDISGNTIQIFPLQLDDGNQLGLDDGGVYAVRTAFEPPESLVTFLKSIAAAGINHIALSFSLGNLPLIGFGGDFISTYLITEDGGDFALDDGSTLDVYTDEVAPSPDGFLGYGEMVFQVLATDDTGLFYISSNIVDPINVGLLVKGINDVQPARLVMQSVTQVPDFSALMTDDGGVLITDDLGELSVYADADVLIEDYLVLENDDPFATPDYQAEEGDGILVFENDDELLLNIFNVLDDPTPLLVFDSDQVPIGGGLGVEVMVG
jgi:hypothetical protein